MRRKQWAMREEKGKTKKREDRRLMKNETIAYLSGLHDGERVKGAALLVSYA